jgi:hypothetical protein
MEFISSLAIASSAADTSLVRDRRLVCLITGGALALVELVVELGVVSLTALLELAVFSVVEFVPGLRALAVSCEEPVGAGCAANSGVVLRDTDLGG